MTIAYHNGHENEQFFTDVEQLEHQDKSMNIGNVSGYETSVSNAITQEFKIWRQQLQDIVNQMRQAPDLDMLLKVTVAKIREKISCDRALIYNFTSLESGSVLAESRTLGWTPTLGENIPGILFGLHTNQDYVEPVIIDDINPGQLSPYQKP
jgi:methyl-accepting chemotaxis protein PixJ